MTYREMINLFNENKLENIVRYSRIYTRGYGRVHTWEEEVEDCIVCFQYGGKFYISIFYHNGSCSRDPKEFTNRNSANAYFKKVVGGKIKKEMNHDCFWFKR